MSDDPVASLPWETKYEVRAPQGFDGPFELTLKTLLLHLSAFCSSLSRSINEPISDDLQLHELLNHVENSSTLYQKIFEAFRSLASVCPSPLIEALVLFHRRIPSELQKRVLPSLNTPALSSTPEGSGRRRNHTESRHASETDHRILAAHFFVSKIILVVLETSQMTSVQVLEVNQINLVSFCFENFLSPLVSSEDPKVKASWKKSMQVIYSQILAVLSTVCLDEILNKLEEHFKKRATMGTERMNYLSKIANYLLPSIEDNNQMNVVHKWVGKISSNLQQKKLKRDEIIVDVNVLNAILFGILVNQQLFSPTNAKLQQSSLDIFQNVSKVSKKLKDPSTGFMLEVVLCSNCINEHFSRLFPSIIEKHPKVSKSVTQQEEKIKILEAVFILIYSACTKISPENFSSVLDFSIKTIIDRLRTEIGSLSPKKVSPVYIDSIVDLGTLCCLLDLSSGIEQLVLENLQLNPSESPEKVLIGLQIFKNIANFLHITFDKAFLFSQQVPTSFDLFAEISKISSPNYPNYSLYRKTLLLRCSMSLKTFTDIDQNQLLRVRQNFDSIIRSLDAQLGSSIGHIFSFSPSVSSSSTSSSSSSSSTAPSSSTSSSSSSSSAAPSSSSSSTTGGSSLRHQTSDLLLMNECIKLMSSITPATISSLEVLYILVRYSFHYDRRMIGSEALDLLHRLFLSRPWVRSSVVELLALFIISIPYHAVQVEAQLRGLKILNQFLSEWSDPHIINRMESDVESVQSLNPKFTPSTIEGVALVLLCTSSKPMRAEVWNTLQLVRTINKKLPAELRDPDERLVSVLEKMEPKIIKSTFAHHDFQLPSIIAPGGPLEVFFKVGKANITIKDLVVGHTTGFIEGLLVTSPGPSSPTLGSSDPFELEWSSCLANIVTHCFSSCRPAFFLAFQHICKNSLQDRTAHLLQAIASREKQVPISGPSSSSSSSPSLTSSTGLSSGSSGSGQAINPLSLSSGMSANSSTNTGTGSSIGNSLIMSMTTAAMMSALSLGSGSGPSQSNASGSGHSLPSVGGSGSSMTLTLLDDIILWRNYLIVLCSIGDGDEAHKFRIPTVPGSASSNPLAILSYNMKWVASSVLSALASGSIAIRTTVHMGLRLTAQSQILSIPLALFDYEESHKKKDIGATFRLESYHLFSSILERMGPDRLSDRDVSKRFFEYLTEMKKTLDEREAQLTKEAQPSWWLVLETVQLRYDFLKSAALLLLHQRSIRPHVPVAFQEMLLNFSLRHCGHGLLADEQREADQKNFDSIHIKKKNKDESITDGLVYIRGHPTEIIMANPSDRKQLLLNICDAIHFWGLASIQSILTTGVSAFQEIVIRRDSATILAIQKTLIESENPKTIQQAQACLRACITSDPRVQSEVLDLFITYAYESKSDRMGRGFFKAIVSTIQSEPDVSFNITSLLNLALYFMAESDLEVRKEAAQLVHWMSTRFFRIQQSTFQLGASSQCSDLYLQQLEALVKHFSERHEELRLELLDEVMIRLPILPSAAHQHRMIAYLVPLLSLVNLCSIDDESIDHLLKQLTALTLYFGEQDHVPISQIWQHLSQPSDNQSPALIIIQFFLDHFESIGPDFRLARVAQKIITYVARQDPQVVAADLVSQFSSTHIQKKSRERRHSTFSSLRYDRGTVSSSLQSLSTSNSEPLAFDTEFVPQNKALPFFHPVRNFAHQPPSLFPSSSAGERVTRGHFSLLFLSELVLENTAVWEPYLAPILHACFCSMDQSVAFVSATVKILFRNIVFRVVSQNVKETSKEAKAMKELVGLVDRSGDRPLWEKESITRRHLHIKSTLILKSYVDQTIQCFQFLPAFKDQWIAEALAISETRDIHTICRSVEVLTSLRTVIDKDSLHMVLTLMREAIASRSSRHAIQLTATLLLYLKSSAQMMTASHLRDLPHLFWSIVAVLHTDIKEEFVLALEALDSLVDVLQNFSDKNILVHLEASIPTNWKPSFTGISIFLIKGLLLSSAEPIAVNLFVKLSRCASTPVLDVIEDRRMLSNIIALLPVLLSTSNAGQVEAICASLAGGFTSLGQTKIATLLTHFPKYHKTSEGNRRFLVEISDLLAPVFFPKHEAYAFTLLTEILDHNTTYKPAALQIMNALIRNSRFDHGSLMHSHSLHFAGSLTKLLRSSPSSDSSSFSSSLSSTEGIGMWLEGVSVLQQSSLKCTPSSAVSICALPTADPFSFEITDVAFLSEIEKPSNIWKSQDLGSPSLIIALDHILTDIENFTPSPSSSSSLDNPQSSPSSSSSASSSGSSGKGWAAAPKRVAPSDEASRRTLAGNRSATVSPPPQQTLSPPIRPLSTLAVPSTSTSTPTPPK